MSHFANGLKQLRLERDLTQAALAKELKVTQNAIFNWENEKREPNLDMIEKIANYFDTSLLYLLEGREEYKKKHDIKTAESTEMENAIKTAPRIYVHENGKKTIDHPITNELVIFTSPSISRAEADAQEKIHELFDLIFEDAVDKKRESTTMQVHEILTSYNQLNDVGREEAIKRINELTEIPKYTKPDDPPA